MKRDIIAKSIDKKSSHVIKKSLKRLNKTGKICREISSPDEVLEYIAFERESDFIKNTFRNKHTKVSKDENGYTMIMGRKDMKKSLDNKLVIAQRDCNIFNKGDILYNILNAYIDKGSMGVYKFFVNNKFIISEFNIDYVNFIEPSVFMKKCENDNITFDTFVFTDDEHSTMITIDKSEIYGVSIVTANCDGILVNREFLEMINAISIRHHKKLYAYITYDHIVISHSDIVLFTFTYDSINNSIVITFPPNTAVSNTDRYEQVFRMRG